MGIFMIQETVLIQFTLNGQPETQEVTAGMSVLEMLRDLKGFTGTKEGCGIGECGACTIQVEGKAINSCLMPAAQLDNKEVWTIEGLGQNEELHPVQESFLDHHAVQCGFCTPGLVMSTKALIEENSAPDRKEIAHAVSGNLCRCTGYQQILSAVENAVEIHHKTSKRNV